MTAAMAASPLQLHLARAHVAAAICIADALGAEARRGFTQLLPQPGRPVHDASVPARSPWLAAVSLEAGGLTMVCAPVGGALNSSNWQVSSGMHAPKDATVSLHCSALSAAVAVLADDMDGLAAPRPFVAATVLQVAAAWSDGLTASSPAADISMGRLPASMCAWPARTGDSLLALHRLPTIRTGVVQHTPTGPVRFTPMSFKPHVLGASLLLATCLHLTLAPALQGRLPPATLGSDGARPAQTGAQGPMRLSGSVQDVSTALLPEQMVLLNSLGRAVAARPALPALQTYPPSLLADGPAIEVGVSVTNMSAQLCSTPPQDDTTLHPGLSWHIQGLDCRASFNITWVSQLTTAEPSRSLGLCRFAGVAALQSLLRIISIARPLPCPILTSCRCHCRFIAV